MDRRCPSLYTICPFEFFPLFLDEWDSWVASCMLHASGEFDRVTSIMVHAPATFEQQFEGSILKPERPCMPSIGILWKWFIAAQKSYTVLGNCLAWNFEIRAWRERGLPIIFPTSIAPAGQFAIQPVICILVLKTKDRLVLSHLVFITKQISEIVTAVEAGS